MDTADQRLKLAGYVTELYEKCGVNVEPLHPKVLVRVLPREQKVGSLFIPEGRQQNKPTLEGVVLKTWRPFYQKIYLDEVGWVTDENANKEAVYSQLVKSELEPGDHVLFPHIEYGITPIWNLDEGKGDYRMVPEQHIMGKLEYQDVRKRDWLRQLLEERDGQLSDEELSDYILKHADIFRRDIVSMTMSGA